MKVIELEYPLSHKHKYENSIVLALGFFDGLHQGHQEVLARAKQVSTEKGYPLAVLSFKQHPSVVFNPEGAETISYLSPLSRKKELLEQCGVDIFYLIDFSLTFSKIPPQTFVDQYIVGLGAKVVVAGFDYTYGPHEIANMQRLTGYAKGRFEVVRVSKVTKDNEKVGSTFIRQMLKIGQVNLANSLLGYPYQISGKVAHGFGRGGKLLGYPTANLDLIEPWFIPSKGVYIGLAKVLGKWYPAMASIGMNPTFSDVSKEMIEVHLLDFDEDIYGEMIQIKWLQFIRPEIKFNSIEALISQLQKDEEMTRSYFTKEEFHYDES